MSEVEFKFCKECFGATIFVNFRCELCVRRASKEKQQRLRAFQKFLKKNILWEQLDREFNMAREYNNEQFAVLEGRDMKNPMRLGIVHFVPDLTYVKAIFKFNPSFYQICINMETFTVEHKNYRPREPFDRWWENVKS